MIFPSTPMNFPSTPRKAHIIVADRHIYCETLDFHEIPMKFA